MKATSTVKAMVASRNATALRRSRGMRRNTLMKMGRLPSGSSTSSSRMSAEKKVWSMVSSADGGLRLLRCALRTDQPPLSSSG